MELKSYLNWITGITTVAIGLVFASLILTNPTNIGPAGVTFWFVGVFVALQGSLALFFFNLKRGNDTVGPYQKLTSSLRQGLLLSGVLTISLALSSLRQLSLRDIGLMVALAALIEVFFRARRR